MIRGSRAVALDLVGVGAVDELRWTLELCVGRRWCWVWRSAAQEGWLGGLDQDRGLGGSLSVKSSSRAGIGGHLEWDKLVGACRRAGAGDGGRGTEQLTNAAPQQLRRRNKRPDDFSHRYAM